MTEDDFQKRAQVSMLSFKMEEFLRPANFEAPFFSLPPGYQMAPIFPFGGVYLRFLFRHESNPEKTVSVYFDTINAAGIMDAPYYEAYPIQDDTRRYWVGEEELMMADIIQELAPRMLPAA